MNKQQNTFLFYIILLTISILIYNLNQLYPIYNDDWSYSFIHGDNKPVKNITDVIKSQYNHYFTWGGRSVLHVIDQLLLINPKWGKLINSLSFVYFIIISYKIININKKTNIWILLFYTFMIYIFQFPFGETVLWITGSANYLWGCLIILTFLYPYYSYFQNKQSNDSTLKSIFFFFFGIISGWTNENMITTQIFFILYIFWFSNTKINKIPKWMIFGFIGLVIGGMVMVLAPGNYVRAETIDNIHPKTFSEKIKFQLYIVIKRYIINLAPLVIIYLFILYRIKKLSIIKISHNKTIINSCLFLLSAHVGWITMFASPGEFPSRATFSIVTFAIISISILYSQLEFLKYKYYFQGIAFLFIISLSIYYMDNKNLSYINELYTEREKIISQTKNKEEKNFISYEISLPIKFNYLPDRYGFRDLSANPKYWTNKKFSEYHKIKSIKVIPKENH